MTFILCRYDDLMMVLYDDKSSTTENHTLRVGGLAWTGSTTSPRDIVAAPLNPNKSRIGFSKADDEHPICL